MKGTVAVPTGIFAVTDGVEFEVRPRDAGILLWLTDRRVNRRYEIKIDEAGTVISRCIVPVSETAAAPEPPEGLLPPGLATDKWRLPSTVKLTRTLKKPSKVKFLFHPDGSNRRRLNHAAVFGGYRHLNSLVILYRVSHSHRGIIDGLMRIVPSTDGRFHRILEEAMADEGKIAPEDWDRFLELPTGAAISICGRLWKKVAMEDLECLKGASILPIPNHNDSEDLAY